ncbi:hypothetical protein MN608_11327 [Microdochium nivale]|nr:hypothetical protein MN608_11327 [Microdochium nivale]
MATTLAAWPAWWASSHALTASATTSPLAIRASESPGTTRSPPSRKLRMKSRDATSESTTAFASAASADASPRRRTCSGAEKSSMLKSPAGAT